MVMLVRRLLLPLVGLLLGGVLLWLVVVVLPPRFTAHRDFDEDHEELKAQNDVRTTLLQGLGALLVLTGAAIGASVTYGGVRETRRQIAQTAAANEEQFTLIREGQITDRYTKAVDQLGHEELAVRVGGVYALQRIARDSRGDRATIAEVLCAYARSAERTALADEDPESHTFEKRAPHVQAALTVLAEWWRRVGGEPEWRDLHGADFQDALLGYAGPDPTLERSHPAGKFWHAIYACPADDMPGIIAASRAKNAGYIYVTDMGDPGIPGKEDAWRKIASYFVDEIFEVRNRNTPPAVLG
jgi:hypothetical protein